MNKDLNIAKSRLIKDITLVIVKDDNCISFTLDGIKPLIKVLNENINISGYSLADKIVGKAQAMLIVKANIKEVYAKVLSEKGKEILEKFHIPYEYETLTKEIINRKGDDVCPMEKAVNDISDIEEAYQVLKKKTLEMI